MSHPKAKKGFSMELYVKKAAPASYTVYFQTKGKVVYCFIEDNVVDCVFRAKAVCHQEDSKNFDESVGKAIALDRCLIKRHSYYQSTIKSYLAYITACKQHELAIEHKALKMINKKGVSA